MENLKLDIVLKDTPIEYGLDRESIVELYDKLGDSSIEVYPIEIPAQYHESILPLIQMICSHTGIRWNLLKSGTAQLHAAGSLATKGIKQIRVFIPVLSV